MAEYLIRLTAPLDEPHVTRIWSGELVYGSKQADRVIVTATSGGEKVTLTGTVTAKMLQADGNTLTWTGVLEDGEAQVLLPANAYEVEGAAILNIFADNGDVRTPLAVMRLMVSKSISASEIVPAGSVPDLQSLLSEITAMEAATVNANAAAANASESAEAYNAIITELDGTVYTQYLRDANMTSGEYYTLSDGVVTETESSAQKRWEPIELPAGTYTYLRIVSYYSYVDDGTTITKLRNTTGTNSSPITVTFATPVTLYVSASTTSAGNNAMLCNGSSVPESYVEGAYSAELTRVDDLDADVSDLKSAIENIAITETINSTNKYDKDHVQAGYWLTTDGVTLVENDNYRACETYIPVIGGTTYKTWWVNNGSVESNSWNYVAWYTASKTFISGDSISTDTVTAPDTAAYVRFTAQKNKYSTFMAVSSEITPTEYIPYAVTSTTTLNQNIIIPQLTKLSPLRNKKIDVIGDSWSAVNDTASVKYTNLLESIDGADVEVLAVSGSGFHKPTSSNKPFYTQALSVRENSDIVLIFGSFNDVSDIVDGTQIGQETDTGTTTICGCINTTINNILSVNPSAKIMFVTPGAWSGYNANNDSNNANNTTALSYVQAIKDVCFKRGYECKDALRTMNLKPWIAAFKNAYQPDGTHPNNAGHLKYVYPVIKNYLTTVV